MPRQHCKWNILNKPSFFNEFSKMKISIKFFWGGVPCGICTAVFITIKLHLIVISFNDYRCMWFISEEILIKLYLEVCVLLLFCRPVSYEKKVNLKFERFSLGWCEIVCHAMSLLCHLSPKHKIQSGVKLFIQSNSVW